MKELLEEIEKREDFKEWLGDDLLYEFSTGGGFYTIWGEMPDTAKLAIIQEWLREKGINIYVSLSGTEETTWFYSVDNRNIQHGSDESYNDALSAGIKEALKLI